MIKSAGACSTSLNVMMYDWLIKQSDKDKTLYDLLLWEMNKIWDCKSQSSVILSQPPHGPLWWLGSQRYVTAHVPALNLTVSKCCERKSLTRVLPTCRVHQTVHPLARAQHLRSHPAKTNHVSASLSLPAENNTSPYFLCISFRSLCFYWPGWSDHIMKNRLCFSDPSDNTNLIRFPFWTSAAEIAVEIKRNVSPRLTEEKIF